MKTGTKLLLLLLSCTVFISCSENAHVTGDLSDSSLNNTEYITDTIVTSNNTTNQTNTTVAQRYRCEITQQTKLDLDIAISENDTSFRTLSADEEQVCRNFDSAFNPGASGNPLCMLLVIDYQNTFSKNPTQAIADLTGYFFPRIGTDSFYQVDELNKKVYFDFKRYFNFVLDFYYNDANKTWVDTDEDGTDDTFMANPSRVFEKFTLTLNDNGDETRSTFLLQFNPHSITNFNNNEFGCENREICSDYLNQSKWGEIIFADVDAQCHEDTIVSRSIYTYLDLQTNTRVSMNTGMVDPDDHDIMIEFYRHINQITQSVGATTTTYYPTRISGLFTDHSDSFSNEGTQAFRLYSSFETVVTSYVPSVLYNGDNWRQDMANIGTKFFFDSIGVDVTKVEETL